MTLTQKILYTARKTLSLSGIEETAEDLRAVITAMKDEKEERGALSPQEEKAYRRLLAN